MATEDEFFINEVDDSFKLIRFPASRHSSALTYSPQEEILQLWESGSADIPKVPAIATPLSVLKTIAGGGRAICNASIHPHIIYYHILSTAYRHADPPIPVLTLKEMLEISVEGVSSDFYALVHSHPALEDITQVIRRKLDAVSLGVIAAEVALINGMRKFLVQIRNTCQHSQVKMCAVVESVLTFQGLTVKVAYPILICVSDMDPNTAFLLNYDQLLMLTDTINCRFMTVLACLINGFLAADDLPSPDLVKRLYSWGDDLIVMHGCSAYCLIENFEDIVTNAFVNFPGSDPLGLGLTFTDTLNEGIREKCLLYKVPPEGVERLITILGEIRSVNVLSEVFGLRKHWGNPMVSADRSSLAVIDKITEDLPVSGIGVVNLHASFNRMITLEYIKLNGEWPKGEFIVSKDLPTYPLERAYKHGVTRLPETNPGHSHLHWALFVFHQNCTLDTFDNPLDIITDKSISLYRDDLDFSYIRQLMKFELKGTPKEQRRLILEYMREDKPTIREIFHTVMTNTIPMRWFANSSCMKGTEMKHDKARLFAVLTYEMRQYFVATEDLIKSHIFRYNPHQTMTMDEPTLLSRLRDVTKQMDVTSESRYLSVMHIIDFSKWNLRMKYSNTALVFRSIDDFLGTPGLIEMSHIIFSSMLNIVQDPFHPPEQSVHDTENDTVWRFHNRGWEGQRQKGWTALTSALLSDLQRRTGVKSIICGQGDNQTLLSSFRIPNMYKNADEWIAAQPTEVRELIDDFYKLLSTECELVGLKVKTGESCRSLCYFNYGKRLFFKGVELSMTLKRISKDLTESNSSFPITESLLKTVQGSSTASGLFSHQSIVPIIIGKMSTLMQLWEAYNVNPLLGNEVRRLFDGRSMTPTLKLCSLMLKVPSSLGGPSQPGFLDYFFRGHPDPIAGDFAMLKLLHLANNKFASKVLHLVTQIDSPLYNLNDKQGNKESLIAAPFSLNLKLPRSARRPIADLVLPALSSYCKNTQVKSLFSFAAKRDEKELYKVLSSLEPFSPTVANDIFARTPSGRRLSFLNGLTNTTSLGRLVVDSRSSPLINKVKELEMTQLDHWISLVEMVSNVKVPDFWEPAEHHLVLQQAREMSWGCDIIGVTVPHPAEQFRLVKTKNDLCDITCKQNCAEHVVFTVVSEKLYGPLSPLALNHPLVCRCRGIDPYLGSTIGEGIIQRQLVCLNPDRSWVDAVRLNIIRLWVTKEGSELDELLRSLISLRTDTPLEVVNLATGKPSRVSYNHRAALMATVKTCSSSSTSNFQSRFYISSNRMGRFSHGESNYHMPFGSCFLFFTHCLGIQASLSDISSVIHGPREIYHAHVRSSNVPSVYDGDLTLKSAPSFKLIGDVPPVLFRQFDTMDFQMVDAGLHSTLWHRFERTSITEARKVYAHQLLGDLLVSEILYHESSIGLTKCDYPARSERISAGDVMLVGIGGFIHAVSEMVLLMAPIYIFAIQSETGVSQALYDYLSSFSQHFWASLSDPFKVPRLTEKLVDWAPDCIVQNLTRSQDGISSMLKHAVSIYVVRLLVKHRDSITNERQTTPINICAPTLRVLKLLLSRYMELSILCIPVHGRELIKDRSFFARDMGANVNSLDTDQIRFALGTLLRDFMIISSLLKFRREKPPPVPRLYNLTEPWIDRLRQYPTLLSELHIPDEEHFPKLWKTNLNEQHIYIGDHEVLTDTIQCVCPRFVGTWTLRTECLFTNTGPLSKSHYRFLEVCVSHQLNINSLICLGSSTGTEAAAFSRFYECEHVYINCLRPLSQFSPHMAATYIPTAYLLDGVPRKLINSGPAAMASNDLLLDETISAITDHTKEFIWSGLTCDVELADEQYQTEQPRLILNVCKLILAITKEDTFWAILKIGVDCAHKLHELILPLSLIFYDVTVIRSSFARAGSRLVMILCMNQKTERPARLSEVPKSKVLVSMCSSHFGEQILVERLKERIPGCLQFQSSIRFDIGNIMSVATNSFMSALSVYLPGFLISSYELRDKQMTKIALIEYITSCSLTVRELIGTYARANKERSMIRNGVLMIDDLSIGARLQRIGYRMFKARLLYDCLKPGELSLSDLIRTSEVALINDFSLRIGSIRYIIKIDSGRFIHVTSRYLCEIIGSLYLNKVNVNSPLDDSPFHRRTFRQLLTLRLSGWIECGWTNRFPVFSLKWKWEERALTLALMIFLHYRTMFHTHTTTCYIPNSYIIPSLNAYLKNTVHPDLVYCASLRNASFIWIENVSELCDVIVTHENLYMLVDVVHLAFISRKYKIQKAFRVPWYGIVPRRVLVIISGAGTSQQELQFKYPDLEEMARWTNDLGRQWVGCSCNDCNSELWVLQQFNLSTRDLNYLCGWRKVTTVFDKYH